MGVQGVPHARRRGEIEQSVPRLEPEVRAEVSWSFLEYWQRARGFPDPTRRDLWGSRDVEFALLGVGKCCVDPVEAWPPWIQIDTQPASRQIDLVQGRLSRRLNWARTEENEVAACLSFSSTGQPRAPRNASRHPADVRVDADVLPRRCARTKTISRRSSTLPMNPNGAHSFARPPDCCRPAGPVAAGGPGVRPVPHGLRGGVLSRRSSRSRRSRQSITCLSNDSSRSFRVSLRCPVTGRPAIAATVDDEGRP